MNTRCGVGVALLAAFSLLLTMPVVGENQEQKPDDICQRLFETYLARRDKINTSTIMAASHIVAERGRNTGFWKNVLQELQSDNEKSEIQCVHVLGKMLAIDARARDIIRTGRDTSWIASVRLSPKVVEELIAHGKKADRSRVDHYCIALARARVPETKAFFNMILRNDTGKKYKPGAQFHAAVGLANLADPKGFKWLIANSDDPLPTVSNAWPSRIPNGNVSTCCTAALRELSGEAKLNTKQEWQTWWESVDKETLPKRHVTLVDP